MDSTKTPFYVTTPIYYVNDKPHIGHVYTTLACDVLARFKRLDGYPTYFLTGTDEHGQKVEKSAAKKGIDPQTFTDQVSQTFRSLVHDPLVEDGGENKINFSNNDFIRTTEARHKKGAQAFWKLLEDNGYIYLDKYSGWYSVRDEAYYQESELVDGKAPTGAEVEWVEEESYFFKLSAFEDKLLELYKSDVEFIYPESRRNEVISFVKGGLKDLSISRTTFKWGVPVPGNDKHIMYVWLDALTNYITALGYPDASAPLYQTFWPGIHVVGKDILRFHAVYWPAFLMAANLPVPKKIIAHGWWTNEGQKISKSIGNVIDPLELIEEFGLDQVRYFLMREVPFGNDGNYSRSSMINRINAELSNNIGNLVQRTLSMIQKNCNGCVPESELTDADYALLEEAHITKHQDDIEQLIGRSKLHKVIEDILEIASAANEYIDIQAPWTLKKTDPARMETVLYTLAETIRCIGIMLQPFIPEAAGKILTQVGYTDQDVADGIPFEQLKPDYALQAGGILPKPQGVFPRFEEPKAQQAS